MTEKILYNGELVDCKELDTLTSSEHWNEYKLEDGNILMVKTSLVSVYKAINKTNPDGTPLYIIKSHALVKCRQKD